MLAISVLNYGACTDDLFAPQVAAMYGNRTCGHHLQANHMHMCMPELGEAGANFMRMHWRDLVAPLYATGAEERVQTER